MADIYNQAGPGGAERGGADGSQVRYPLYFDPLLSGIVGNIILMEIPIHDYWQFSYTVL